MKAVWQISAGPLMRRYAEVLLRHGVALIGPGDSGPWAPNRDDSDFDGNYVRRFASELGLGDLVVLRAGLATISAIGIVASDYEYQNAFDDVNGWDLQHCRRVRWCRLLAEHTFGGTPFGASPARCSRVASEEVVDFALRFVQSPPTHWQSVPLPPLPAEQPPLRRLPPSLSNLVAAVSDLVPLYQTAEAFGEPPTEDELLAHFVVPFLRAMGWPPERIAIKWRHIDVSTFTALPRTPASCHLVIEAKRLGSGVEGALEQARGYVEALGVLRDVVVTDGVRWRMYEARGDFAPVAYANLARLKEPAAALFDRMKRP